MREKIGNFDALTETLEKLKNGGLLLASGKKGNPMTIGWGTAGIIWGRPVFLVLVRPSRYSFGLMETRDEFSVNVPADDLKKQVAYCGSASGRDVDKVRECGFTMREGKLIGVPYIEECPVHYECRLIHKNSVINADLDEEIAAKSYASGDLHRIYYGEILGVYREKV